MVVLFVTAIVPGRIHAEKKGKASAGSDAKAHVKMPSAHLDPVVGPCVEAIVASLDKDPKAPTGQVAKLHSTFTVALSAAETPSQKQVYANAIAVCDAITKALDDRSKSKAAAVASAKVPPLSTAGSINKSSPQPGRRAGYLAQQIRKKQEEERAFAENEAKKKADFLHSGAYTAWAERAPKYRQNIMALYTRQSQLELVQEKNDAPVAKPAPVVASAAESAPVTKKEKKAIKQEGKSTQKTVSFAGTWTGPAGRKTFIINEDHTAIRIDQEGERVNGKWTLDQDGEFDIKWEDHARLTGKVSADGQTVSSGKGASWIRKQP